MANPGDMLRAVIFDFNGVLVDDEPIHLEIIQKVLKEEGLALDAADYYANYLGLDDWGCFRTYYRKHGVPLDNEALEALVRRKARYYRECIGDRIVVFPGVNELVPALARRFPLGIASGALRSEIDLILTSIGLKEHFQAIVSTEDVIEGKPDPEIFNKALEWLNGKVSGIPIRPCECLVIEDSREGIRAARAAGMTCLAVTNSHPSGELADARAVVASLEEITPGFLEKLFSPSTKSPHFVE